MSPRVGTLEWARRTSGRLRYGDRLEMLGQVLAVQVAALSAAFRRRLGFRRPDRPRVDVTGLRAPDSRAARKAEALCAEVSPPFLVNHCLRAYLWGRVLAARDGIAFDDELFYVSCLLHDLGLTERFGTTSDDVSCFAVQGGYTARDFARKAGWSEARRDALAEAIILHLNVKVGLEHGPEAYLLRAGSGLDVIGARYWQVAPETRAAVLAQHPRLGFKRAMDGLARAEVPASPGSRIHFLYRYLKFGRRIARSPFDE